MALKESVKKMQFFNFFSIQILIPLLIAAISALQILVSEGNLDEKAKLILGMYTPKPVLQLG